MHFRLQLWMAFFAFIAATAVRAQAPAAAAANAMPPGQIKALKVVGTVGFLLNGQRTELHDNDSVPQAATVVTQDKSSVILVFSNGATTQLGSDTNLVIDEFLQDPFAQQVSVAALTAEPTVSHTRLHLNKGELIGNVKHLNHDKGSTFTIDTPVGAAGIRGTTFRIIFRPSGTGQAFAIFAVSTLEGNVAFNAGGGQGQSGTTPGSQSQNASEIRSRGGAVAVTTGREVVVTVSVETDPTTGQVTVTAPIQVATTTPLNPVVRADLVSQATTMATTIEKSNTTFTSGGATSDGATSGTSSSSSSSGSTDGTKKDDSKSSSDNGSGGTSGGTSSGSTSSGGSSSSTSSGNTSGTASTSGPSTSGSTSTGAASTLTSSIAGGRQINTSPGFTIGGTQTLTPGAGSN